jgi:glycolate oxidase FAD binding subunit
MIHHTPADLTVTAPATMTLADLQAALRPARQWLPIDPPDDSAPLAAILNANASGPRRYGYGRVRDYVIGLKVQLPDGTVVKSGGQVVKNVAGYDLQKLFIGSGGTLVTPLEVTFKLRPLPERESFVQQSFTTLDAAGAAVEAIAASALTPVVFDLYRTNTVPLTLVLGFDGATEDVDWQLRLALELGFAAMATINSETHSPRDFDSLAPLGGEGRGEGARVASAETPCNPPAKLDYDRAFHLSESPAKKLSVLPSRLVEALRPLGNEPFVARAGNGIIYHRADVATPTAVLPTRLLRRVKEAFDPKGLLPQPNV